MDSPRHYLNIPLQWAFEWFDSGLQRNLRRRGWPELTRPESMVMMHVVQGVTRPSDIARALDLTRQAVHVTITQIVEKGVFTLEPDPEDRRHRRVVLTEMGVAMRVDARMIVRFMTAEVGARIGEDRLDHLMSAFDPPWGEPPDFPWSEEELATPPPGLRPLPARRPRGRPPGRPPGT